MQKGEVLGCFEGKTDAQRRSAMREYTERAIREGLEGDGLLERIRYGALLGSEEWTAKMRGMLGGDSREQPALEKARREAVDFEEVAASIAREYGEPWEDLKKRRGHPAKGLAMVMCRRHTGLKLHEIGERCNQMDYAAVSQACHRMEQKISRNHRLAATAKRIAKRLQMSYVET